MGDPIDIDDLMRRLDPKIALDSRLTLDCVLGAKRIVIVVPKPEHRGTAKRKERREEKCDR
jgi:hypothetical protein